MHIVNYRYSIVNVAKTAEPTEMQFGMLNQVGPGITWGVDTKG